MPDTLELVNARGASARLSPFGARLVELRVPDREGATGNVVLGFDTTEEYRRNVDLYFGATIGRVAGRISGAAFSLDGQRYTLVPNEGSNQVHGGAARALDRVDWSAERVDTDRGPGVAFTYTSLDGEEGYPGTLTVRSEYGLSEDNELWTVLTAVSDAPTPVNLTTHAYWNLGGAGPGSILDHELTIRAQRVVALDAALLPDGTFDPVAGTALDFRSPRRLGERLPETEEPWPGFDAAFVLDAHDAEADVVVSLYDQASGRAMNILTTEPSIQMYTANRMPEITGRDGLAYRPGNAICLEPQRFPDAVNRPEFPSVVVTPGEEYRHVSRYRFSVR